MKLAKADLVPTDTNLLDAYASFAELEAACEAFCEQVNARVHRVTRRAPVEMLGRGTGPAAPGPGRAAHRRVRGDPAGPGQHPDGDLRGRPVLGPAPAARCRPCGCGSTAAAPASRSSSCTSAPSGPVEVARHDRATPGSPRIDDAHFPPATGWGAVPETIGRATPRRRSSSPSATAPGCGWPRPPRRARPGSGPRWPKRCQLAKLFDGRGRRLGVGARRGARPVRRGRPRLDPGPPPRRHRGRAGSPRRRGRVPGPGHQRLGRARREQRHPATRDTATTSPCRRRPSDRGQAARPRGPVRAAAAR